PGADAGPPPMQDAADAAFGEALEAGASPTEAFEAAIAAGQAEALEAGVPQEEIDARTEAAREAFDQGMAEGKDAGECFEEASQAGGFNEVAAGQPADDGGLGALESAMGPESSGGEEAFEGEDPLGDAVGQAMDETSEQGGSPAADTDVHEQPGDAGQDDFAPGEADDAPGSDDPSDSGI
ncbi:hypothetical protein OA067_00005, partial [Gammaproteobacteria bacterium]|nr:hypothetical protein [Gammaproteobacteria bacterium]